MLAVCMMRFDEVDECIIGTLFLRGRVDANILTTRIVIAVTTDNDTCSSRLNNDDRTCSAVLSLLGVR